MGCVRRVNEHDLRDPGLCGWIAANQVDGVDRDLSKHLD